ncbi:ankyrin repeat domain-containing protein [Streptomyces sp. NPDC006733]|uniref:ankyrin repeat domain-containing protein n=1 Tax=Streptomyces sp. NPDC006733 TaxID=3155460 RepID=UPI0033DC4ED0
MPAPRATDHALLTAAERGDAAAVRAALAAGAHLEARDADLRTPLLLAARGDHVEAAAVLVAAGADVNAQDHQDDSAWLVTGVTGSVAMLRTLLPAGPDLTLRNRFGGVSVIPAAERGHVAYVQAVLDETDIDVNHVNRLGWTALLEAVILGDGGSAHRQIVQILLAAGATADLADADGVTPLVHAERRGFTDIATLLRDAG